MLILNDDLSIYCTRGDCGEISINARINGEPSVFSAGDVLRLKVFEKKGCDTVVMQRDFTIEEEADSFVISLNAADTKIGKVISKPVDYWYEVELNPDTNPQTIIGYDEDGPKVFKLFPEGKDVDGEDIAVVGPKTLKELVDYTLKQAKESGDFKGEPGKDGEDGDDGTQITTMFFTENQLWHGTETDVTDIVTYKPSFSEATDHFGYGASADTVPHIRVVWKQGVASATNGEVLPLVAWYGGWADAGSFTLYFGNKDYALSLVYQYDTSISPYGDLLSVTALLTKESTIGDIDTALDGIIAIQEALMVGTTNEVLDDLHEYAQNIVVGGDT